MRAVEAMARGGFGLNVVTFHPILNLLTRKRQIDEAYRVMDLMRSVRDFHRLLSNIYEIFYGYVDCDLKLQ